VKPEKKEPMRLAPKPFMGIAKMAAPMAMNN
jgi:hypothetical protein